MDGDMHMQDESKPYIWLRYSTHYTTRDGQSHTLEMSIPVPIGASHETREQLIREAEAGMRQLMSHVDQRAPQSQGIAHTQGGQRQIPQPQVNTRPASTQPAPRTGTRSASIPAPQTGPQPAAGREGQTEPANGERPVTRNGIGASMPSTVLPASDVGGNIQLPQFIQYIKENMDLTPKQAMEILNVKSLTTGINLRDALEQLKAIMSQQSGGQQARRQTSETSNTQPGGRNTNSSTLRNGPSGPLSHTSPDDPGIIEMRVHRSTPRFDEEIDPEELSEMDLEEPFEGGEGLDSRNDFTPQQLEQAHDKINALRESQGATAASASRLQALNNVAISQVAEEELKELVEGVWGVTALKKLKIDQVEALISWAKLEDNFAEQVEVVLAVLEEERYARGNR